MDFASDTCIMTDSIAFLEYRIEWDTVLSECIVQRKRVIARCITWHGNGGGHRGEFPALVTCAYRAMKQMFAPRSVAQSGGDVQAIWVHLFSVQCNRCEVPTEAVCQQDEDSKRNQDHNDRLCMTSVDNSQNM